MKIVKIKIQLNPNPTSTKFKTIKGRLFKYKDLKFIIHQTLYLCSNNVWKFTKDKYSITEYSTGCSIDSFIYKTELFTHLKRIKLFYPRIKAAIERKTKEDLINE